MSDVPEGCKPFDVGRALAGDPLVTRNGCEVLHFKRFGGEDFFFPYVANVGSAQYGYTEKGQINRNGPEHDYDLFMASTSDGRKNDDGKVQAGQLYEHFASALTDVATVATHGAEIYGRDNWRRVDSQRYYDAAHRHLLADARGEFYDPDSGMPHMAHAIWNLLAVHQLKLMNAGQDYA